MGQIKKSRGQTKDAVHLEQAKRQTLAACTVGICMGLPNGSKKSEGSVENLRSIKTEC